MNIMQRGVVTLLRSAITGERLPLPEGFDLELAYPELKKHHMDAMLYEGAVRCGISKQLPVMQQLFRSYCKALLVSEGQLRQIQRIFAAFEENGIDYMPLKGCKLKALYAKPELRYMGDADILIRTEQYEKITAVMEGLGFAFKNETDHELIWLHKELFVELHKHLIPSYNQDFYRHFTIGWQMAVPEQGSRYTMRVEDEWIFLFTHFAKHFRDGGIGCRYLVDLWVYLRNHPVMDQEYLQQVLQDLQLQQFHENIRKTIEVWFEGGQPDDVTDTVTDYIFSSGSWGTTASKTISGAVRGAPERGRAATSRIRYVLQVLFPSVMVLREKYTVLKKYPWLLPAVWLVRPFYKFFWERKDYARHMKNMDTITDSELEQRRKFMQYLGITYKID